MFGDRIALFVGSILIGVLLGGFAAWKVQNWRFTSKIATIQAEHAKVREDLANRARAAEAANRAKETEYREVAAKEQEKNRAKVRDINTQLSAALVELRKRPERREVADGSGMPETASACIGASGAELAAGDAVFLARYSADAEKLEAALDQCEAQYNALRN